MLACRPQLAKGFMQLHSFDQMKSQPLEAHAAAFASVKVGACQRGLPLRLRDPFVPRALVHAFFWPPGVVCSCSLIPCAHNSVRVVNTLRTPPLAHGLHALSKLPALPVGIPSQG